jgi:4'-phosphopantetheinyl transferase
MLVGRQRKFLSKPAQMKISKLKGWPCRLGARDIHVWTLRVQGTRDIADRFYPLLSPDEQVRAERFRFDHLRYSFAASRGILRVLLGHYLQIAPTAIQFVYSASGKPGLVLNQSLHFNASHSGELYVIALTSKCELGVDVERLRPLSDIQAIAERFFSREESAELLALPDEQRELGFFSCWTRKEAYIKATGEGLSAPLDDFGVSLWPGQPACFVHFAHDSQLASQWMLHDLALAPDYAAALAYQDREHPVCLLPILGALEFLTF